MQREYRRHRHPKKVSCGSKLWSLTVVYTVYTPTPLMSRIIALLLILCLWDAQSSQDGLDTPILRIVEPTFGSKLGGTVITLRGFSLPTNNSFCRFGEVAIVTPIYSSENEFICETPAHSVGKVAVDLIDGNQFLSNINKLLFEFTGTLNL